MKIVKIENCQIRENPNWEIMNEGKQYVNLVFQTDQGNQIYVDLAYTREGTLKIDLILMPVLLIPDGIVKTYYKKIEISVHDGSILKDLKIH